MSDKSLKLIRDILLKTFLSGAALTLILWVLTVLLWDFSARIISTLFGIDTSVFALTALWFFTAAKFFLLYVVLTPALGLTWAMRSK